MKTPTQAKDVMLKIHKEFNGDTGLASSSDTEELKAFLKFILPEYDESRVYVSDIKKLVTWYNLLSSDHVVLFEEKNEDNSVEHDTDVTKEEEKKD